MNKYFLLLLLFLLAFSLTAQERPLNTGLSNDEQYYFVGMTLAEVIERFGPPRSVTVARGIDNWQDDVVFRYTGVDFFIHIDRIWQVKFTTTHGISIGDPKAAVLLLLGETAEDNEEHVIVSIPGRNWPLILRINFNNNENVSSIFLYRPDF
ncbi:MAG: hypothetical protein LBC80_06160 [Treponema sp.]|jgi:hypothetical protein|nr:hypothetical protein [Treponema sp.]